MEEEFAANRQKFLAEQGYKYSIQHWQEGELGAHHDGRPISDRIRMEIRPNDPGGAGLFDLIRGYLGDIKTPFNKQRLVDELESLLSRQEVQETMEAYLDPTDRKVLAAVGLLGFPSPGELASFFEGEYSFAEFHGILLNLEERLLVYRFTDQGIHRFALNPVLENLLAPVANDTKSFLYPILFLRSIRGQPYSAHGRCSFSGPIGLRV